MDKQRFKTWLENLEAHYAIKERHAVLISERDSYRGSLVTVKQILNHLSRLK